MKKLMFKYLSVFLVAAITGCSTDDKTIDKVFDEVQTGAFLRLVSTEGNAMNKASVASSAAVTFEFDGQDASLLKSVDFTITFTDNDSEDGVNESVGPISIGNSLSAADFTTSEFGLPIASFSYTLAEALAATGLTADQINGGDRMTLGLSVTLTDGRTFGPGSANGNVAAVGGFYSSPYAFSSLIICDFPPTPGVWTVDMVDTYGDGWQTTDGDSGDPMTITLSDGTVFEVGMCSYWAPSPFECTPTEDYQSATATFTIPSGISSAVWYFPGDRYGEIEFTITSPSGNVVGDFGTNTPAGVLALNLCKEPVN
jgi:hypothetical protein